MLRKASLMLLLKGDGIGAAPVCHHERFQLPRRTKVRARELHFLWFHPGSTLGSPEGRLRVRRPFHLVICTLYNVLLLEKQLPLQDAQLSAGKTEMLRSQCDIT